MVINRVKVQAGAKRVGKGSCGRKVFAYEKPIGSTNAKRKESDMLSATRSWN